MTDNVTMLNITCQWKQNIKMLHCC